MGRLASLPKPRFQEIYAEGKRASGRLMSLAALQGTGLVGVATSRAIGCHARRNRQRRRVVAALQRIAGACDGLDVVVTVKPATESAEFREIEDELKNLVTEMRSRWESGSPSD